MSLYSLPLSSGQTAHLPVDDRAVRYKVQLPVRKRKRSSPIDDELGSANTTDDEEPVPLASTNPLSLTPAEIAQYKLAGLELDQDLPDVQDFPHRGLQSWTKTLAEEKDKKSGSQDAVTFGTVQEVEKPELEVDADSVSKKGQQGLRLQHFKVLVAIMHKCLQDGDVQRALRAWTMLLRFQFKGEEIDLRSTGYWAIGAELLARSETRGRSEETSDSDEDSHSEVPAENGRTTEWGTQSGRQRATEYLGKLILEYPPIPQYPASVSAKDFWLSMLGIEIYGIDFEHKRALKDIGQMTATKLQAIDDHVDYAESPAEAEERRLTERLEVEDQAWSERDQVRQATFTAAESLVMRVDELLGSTAYASNLSIIEIRAQLALYLADLVISESPPEGRDGEGQHQLDENAERKMIYEQRLLAHEQSLERREGELERVKIYVQRIIENGGSDEHFRHLGLDIE